MKKSISLIAATLIFTSLTITAQAQIFSDTPDTERYFTAIEFLASEGIVNGNPDGTYAPSRTLNRAEMIKIVAEGAKIYYGWADDIFDSYADDKCFPDVAANQWYTKYICYGKEKGWVKGYGDGNYRPTQTVTFVEGLKITYQGFDLGYTENTSPWYKDAVDAASEKNYIPFDITGFNDGLQRDQMADLIARIIKDKEGKLEEYLGSRADINVTYDTIGDGIDLTTLDLEDLDKDGTQDVTVDDTVPSEYVTVEITGTGFDPASLTISSGDTVRFINLDANEDSHWPASDNHPTHTVYPGSGIDKCGTSQADQTFDACAPLAPLETYFFTFNETGTWSYHDHLNLGWTGIIVVN